MNQFRKLNKPTFLDRIWNLSRRFFYLNNKINKNSYFEFGSYLYRFKKNINFESNVYIKRNSIIGCANKDAIVSIGKNTTIGSGSIIISSEKIIIGKDCMLAPYVHIVDSNHGMESDKPYNQQENYTSPVSIGDNSWIGSGVVILPGVSIGSGSIVGAGSVVTKSFPENSKIMGIPAKEKDKQ